MTKEAKGVTQAQLKKIALSFPEANEKPSYGKPSFFIAKKFFTRYRKDDNSLVFIVADMHTRDMMLELDPKTYFITDHYRDYPSVLVRMERITQSELKQMLDRRWRQIAPKKLIREIDGDGAAKRPGKAKKKTKSG